MRRRLAEQPRVVAAQVLLGLVLVAGGFALGRTADPDEVPASTTAALAGARSRVPEGRRPRDLPRVPARASVTARFGVA